MATRDNYEKLLGSPNVQKMLDLIANAEGVQHGYNTLFGNERLDDLSSHPNIKKQFKQTDGQVKNTTAAGRYQFLKDTWDGVAKDLGLKDFSPKNQDIAAVALLAQNGALPSVLKGDFKTAVQKSGSTWASLPSSPYAQPKRSWKDLGISNPAREDYQSQASKIVAAYKQKQKEQETKAQPQVDAGRAQRIVEAYQKAQMNNAANQPQGLPDFDANGVITYDQPQAAPQAPEPSLADKALGLGETALSAATGATGGTLGMIGGTIGQAGREILAGNFGTPEAANRIAQNAAASASNLTYAPRTQAGQDYVQTIADVTEPLAALTPATAEIGLAAQAARGALPQATIAAQRTTQAVAPVVERATQAAQRPIQATQQAISSGVNNLRDAVGLSRAPKQNPAANIGAAQVDQATVRQSLAQDLPYSPELTQGQMTRDPGQLKFEVETAKNAELGAPIRQRYEQQHQVMQQNLDAFIDMTGAKATNMREAGIAVDKALQKQAQIDKNRVRVAYAKADKSDEAQYPVDLTQPVKNGEESMSVLDYLNSQPDLKSTPIIADAKSIALKLGIASRDESGNLIPARPTVKQMEKWRSEINQNTNIEAPNVRQTAILKSMIDQHVEPVVGDLYRAARLERKKMADHWENRKIITDLTSNKKGTEDRTVALEDIQKRIIHDGSLDDLRFARRALLTAGDEGKQAWKDIQGQTLQEIKDASTAGVATDAQGNQMISPAALNKAINKLDKEGKLEYIFGPQGAEKLRAVNELSKTLFTVPSSAAINYSNTAATLTAALDIALSGFSGFPAPVASALRLATKHIKDNKIRKRVNQALNLNQSN
ncbi:MULTISPECIES: hypothetical protein [Acinetobacter]|uniref:hypothetical protein n=1 Tax=Acinetobacter TaxID=469 RepID=UPI00124E19D5|nr:MULTISPECIES: hypothetical protein [Acinetobacter]